MSVTARGLGDLLFLSWVPPGPTPDLPQAIASGYRELLAALGDAEILLERVFGDLDESPHVLAPRREALGPVVNVLPAPTYVAGSPTAPTGVAGIHVIAARPSSPVVPLTSGEEATPCGRLVHGSTGSYLALSGLAPARSVGPATAPGEVASASLERASELLAAVGWSFASVVRTWFHLDGILAWYDAFNCARTGVFDRLGLAGNGSVFPASTAVGGVGASGSPCTLDLLAIRGMDQRPAAVRRLTNPRQGEAHAYGSAFSRGVAVTVGSEDLLMVSGTAAIDGDGRSLHPGDFEAQVATTIDTVRELLATQGAALESTCQATAFVKRQRDASRLDGALRLAGWPAVPLVSTLGDICRDELLFELDAVALVRSGRH